MSKNNYFKSTVLFNLSNSGCFFEICFFSKTEDFPLTLHSNVSFQINAVIH